MTEQSYPVEVGHPPSALLRAINPVLGFLLRTPLAGSLGNQLMVLDFTGRKSGRHFSLPLSAHVIDNVLYALTGAAWKYNFSDGATAQVVHNGKTTAMRGDLCLRCARSYGPRRAQRMMGFKFRDRRIPTLEEFTEAVDRLQFTAIKLTPAG